MKGCVCIATPGVGRPSETFIRRHIECLATDNSVLVTSKALPGCDWNLPAKVFFRSEWQKRNWILSGIFRRLGIDLEAVVFRRFLRKNRVSVVLSEFLGSSLRIHQMVRSLGIPFYAHAHGHDVSARLRDPEYRKAYLAYEENPLAEIVTISRVTAERLASIGISKEKIHVIPYGVDMPGLRENIDRRSHQSEVRCLAVGRMVSKKAPILLLDSFRQALQNNRDLHLNYVGGGPLFPAVEQYVTALGLRAHVELHQSLPHDHVLKLYREADLFLQHSRVDPESGDEEGLPLSILEAMAHGVPVISTRHAGIPEAVIEDECGLLSDENDHIAMAVNILRLAEKNGLRRTMGLNARKRAEEFFSWERERESLSRLLFSAKGE